MRSRATQAGRTIRWLLPAVLLTAAAAVSHAQRPHVTARVGYDFDSRDALVSMGLTLPVSTRVEFYPTFDVYTPAYGNRVGFNGDFKVRFPAQPGPDLYLGGGLGVVNRTQGNFNRTEFGANLIMGIESRTGWIHPFAEGRVRLHNQSTFNLIGGLNLTIGDR